MLMNYSILHNCLSSSNRAESFRESFSRNNTRYLSISPLFLGVDVMIIASSVWAPKACRMLLPSTYLNPLSLLVRWLCFARQQNMSKSKTLAATATRPVSNPSPKMETKSTSATRLAYEHADDTSSQRASPTPVQPPHRPLRFQARSAQGSQRSSLSSQRSRISQASTSSAASSRTKSPSPRELAFFLMLAGPVVEC